MTKPYVIKFFILALGILALHFAACEEAKMWQPSSGHTQIPIWPGAVPDAEPANKAEGIWTGKINPVAGKPWVAVENVSLPTMTLYSPKGKNTGVAVVVFPGGGYQELAIDLEGSEVCDWLIEKGISCVLLKYRVPNTGPHYDKTCNCHKDPKVPMALQDAQRTMGLVRLHAAEWQIDPHKIGVLGFSAGGHLVADVSTHFEKRAYREIDAADKESSRPDFAVAVYPGHMLEHTNKPFELNPKLPVSSKTPPTFLLQNEDDPVDRVENSLVYFEALRKAGVPAEMHIYAHGGHAFGLRPTKFPVSGWPQLVEKWLGTLGMTPE